MFRPFSLLLTTPLLLVGFAVLPPAAAQSAKNKRPAPLRQPISGTRTFGVQFHDQVMLRHMERIRCSSATLAVSFRGRLVDSRGYGLPGMKKVVSGGPPRTIAGDQAIIGLPDSNSLNRAAGHSFCFDTYFDWLGNRLGSRKGVTEDSEP
jgi:hypothetical protein